MRVHVNCSQPAHIHSKQKKHNTKHKQARDDDHDDELNRTKNAHTVLVQALATLFKLAFMSIHT